MEGIAEQTIETEERPLVSFLYRLLHDGDVAPARLEQVLDELEAMPPAVRVRCALPDVARYAIDAANRLERLARPPITVRGPAPAK